MNQTTCQNLRNQLQEIIALKEDFDAEIKKASELKDLQPLTNLKNNLEGKLVNLKKELFQSLEIVQKLKTQYHESIALGATHNLYDLENPTITGVDGGNYPAPTWDQILKTLTPAQLENIKKLSNPTLFVVPFGLPLRKIFKALNLKLKTVYKQWEETQVTIYDTTNDKSSLRYFGNFSKKGFTKAEILQMQGGLNQFPGWQVFFTDSCEEVTPETINKDPVKLIKELHQKGLDMANWEETAFILLKKLSEVNFDLDLSTMIIWANMNSEDEGSAVYLSHLNLKDRSMYTFLDDLSQLQPSEVTPHPKNFGCKILVRIV